HTARMETVVTLKAAIVACVLTACTDAEEVVSTTSVDPDRSLDGGHSSAPTSSADAAIERPPRHDEPGVGNPSVDASAGPFPADPGSSHAPFEPAPTVVVLPSAPALDAGQSEPVAVTPATSDAGVH